MRARLPILALALLLSGCAGNAAITPSGPVRATVIGGDAVDGRPADAYAFETGAGRINSSAHFIAAMPDSAWPALLGVYRDLGLTVTGVDERVHRVISRQRLRRRLGDDPLSTFLDCGQSLTGTVADQYQVEVDLSSALTARTEGGSVVETSLAARAYNPQGSSSSAVSCGSNGALEARIAALVGTRTLHY